MSDPGGGLSALRLDVCRRNVNIEQAGSGAVRRDACASRLRCSQLPIGRGTAMSDSQDFSKAAARLLDPRFEYTPAAATDIAATWRRHGFDPQANEQRRQLVLRRFVARARESFAPATGLLVDVTD